MKVFVVVNEWAYDFDADQEVKVFATYELARKALEDGYDDFVKHDYEEDSATFNTKIDGGHYAYVYCDGDWACNHISWTIYEEDVL